MTPAQAIASYRRQLAAHGESVTLRRINATPPNTEQPLTARVVAYRPEELTGAIQQGDLRVVFLAEDIGSFPLPLRERSSDKLVIDGIETTIQAVDTMTRRIAGTTVAYELRVRG